MFDAHDAMYCISQNASVFQTEGRRRLTPDHFFRSQDDMAELFSDLPEAIENSVEIARRCAFRAEPRTPILPKFTENEADEMRRLATEGLKK